MYRHVFIRLPYVKLKQRVNFFPAQQPPVGLGLLIAEVSKSHSDTLGRIPLDEWSARRRDSYLHYMQN